MPRALVPRPAPQPAGSRTVLGSLLLLLVLVVGGLNLIAPRAPASTAPLAVASPPSLMPTGTPISNGSPPTHSSLPASSSRSDGPGITHRSTEMAVPGLSGPARPPSFGLLPAGAAVNPYRIRSSEPAPMGVTDYGVDASGGGSTYSTDRFLGTMQIRSWSTLASGGWGGGWVTIQLNVVVVLTSGATTRSYWIQDVPVFNTTSRQIDFLDNIWNMSSYPSSLNSGDVSGNGTIASSPSFYWDETGYNYPGSDVNLTLPVNVSAEVITSTVSGITHVEFLFDDGSGWVSYDNVSFPWSSGWTNRGFVVDGTQYNGYGLFDDAEWIIGGPAGGSRVANQKSNLTALLYYWNGHNFEAPPNAFNFGSDTAEDATNVVEALPSGPSPGVPAANVTAGSGSLGRLWSYGSVSTLNVTPGPTNGTLYLRGAPTPYSGSAVDLTVLSGSYRLSVLNGSTTVSARTVNPTAGQHLIFSMPGLAASPASAMAGAPVNVTGHAFAPSAAISVVWPGSGGTLCSVTSASSGWFNCTFTVPKTASGYYGVSASDTTTSADLAVSEFHLTTDLRVTANVSTTATDIGVVVGFHANATGGFGPYAGYTWRFGDGSLASTATGNLTHRYATAGTLRVTAEVTDNVGSVVNTTLTITVNALPIAAVPTPGAPAADLGQTVTFAASGRYGTPPYVAYGWSGLAPGCGTSTTSELTCTFTKTGTFYLQVTLTDSVGVTSALSGALAYTVSSAPTIGAPSASPSSVDIGQRVAFHVAATIGSGSPRYLWTGLPPGCGGTTALISCTPIQTGTFPITVAVTDSNGASAANATVLGFSVYVLPSLPATPTLSHASVDVGEPVTFSIAASGGSGGFVYSWGGLPTGCTTVTGASVNCTPSSAGDFEVNVSATDSNHVSTGMAFAFLVWPRLLVVGPTTDVAETDVGHAITLGAQDRGGAGGVAFAWQGLPPGCDLLGASVDCRPAVPGSWTVNVRIVDANQANATGAPITLLVHARPSVASLTAVPATTIVGKGLAFAGSSVNGTPGYSYAWTGLPNGCASVNRTTLDCTPTVSGSYLVTLRVTDSVGETANASVRVIVGAAFLGLPAIEGYAVVAAIALVAAAAAALLVRSRRRKRPGPATARSATP